MSTTRNLIQHKIMEKVEPHLSVPGLSQLISSYALPSTEQEIATHCCSMVKEDPEQDIWEILSNSLEHPMAYDFYKLSLGRQWLDSPEARYLIASEINILEHKSIQAFIHKLIEKDEAPALYLLLTKRPDLLKGELYPHTTHKGFLGSKITNMELALKLGSHHCLTVLLKFPENLNFYMVEYIKILEGAVVYRQSRCVEILLKAYLSELEKPIEYQEVIMEHIVAAKQHAEKLNNPDLLMLFDNALHSINRESKKNSLSM